MDATATTSKRARDDSEWELDLNSPDSMLTHELTKAVEPHEYQPQSEKDDARDGGKQDSTGDSAQQPPRKKNRRYKQQQRQARQDDNTHKDCTYCLATGNPELASEHPLKECHWKMASDAINAYELAEGIHKQKHEGEITALKARHDVEVKTLKDQHEAQIQNLNARVTNLQDKNKDLADRIKSLTEEIDFLTAQIDYVHDLMDRLAQGHTKTLDGLAAQHGKEVGVLTEQYEKEKADKEEGIKLIEKEMLRQIDLRHQLRLILTQSHENEVRELRQVIKELETKRDDNGLAAQHKAETEALEKHHKREIKRREDGCERIIAKLEAEHETKIKELEEVQQVELWKMEHQFEDRVDLIRYQSEEKNHRLQQELAEVQENRIKLRQELTESREKTQSLAMEKIQLLVERKAAIEKPKLDGYLQHMVEKLKKEVKKYEAMVSEFKKDKEIYLRKIEYLEEDLAWYHDVEEEHGIERMVKMAERRGKQAVVGTTKQGGGRYVTVSALASMMSARRVLECMLRAKGVTDEEIKARVGGTAMQWDLDAESSDESGVESEFEQSTDSDSEPDEDTDVEMQERDTDVDEQEEDDEEEEQQEEEIAVDREDSFHRFDDSEMAKPDSVDEDMSDVVSESTELDEVENEVENKSVQDGGESSSNRKEVPGNEERSGSSSEKSSFFKDNEEDPSHLPPVTEALPVSHSQPYNPAAPITPILPNHMPIIIGEGARQMTYVHDPYGFLSSGYWVENVNLNATTIPQQQQQRSTNPSPTRSLGKGQDDDDESTTLDFEEEKGADDGDEVRTIWEEADSLEDAIARGWTQPSRHASSS